MIVIWAPAHWAPLDVPAIVRHAVSRAVTYCVAAVAIILIKSIVNGNAGANFNGAAGFIATFATNASKNIRVNRLPITSMY